MFSQAHTTTILGTCWAAVIWMSVPAQAKAQTPQCSLRYTSCVLHCNQLTVTYSDKAQAAFSSTAKARWEKLLNNTQTTCIPRCYRSHCVVASAAVARKTVRKRPSKRISKHVSKRVSTFVRVAKR